MSTKDFTALVWNRAKTIGRAQIAIRVYHHTYSTGPDRWVVQQQLIWDKKDRNGRH